MTKLILIKLINYKNNYLLISNCATNTQISFTMPSLPLQFVQILINLQLQHQNTSCFQRTPYSHRILSLFSIMLVIVCTSILAFNRNPQCNLILTSSHLMIINQFIMIALMMHCIYLLDIEIRCLSILQNSQIPSKPFFNLITSYWYRNHPYQIEFQWLLL